MCVFLPKADFDIVENSHGGNLITVTLVLPLEATTVNNPSDSRINSEVTAGVTLKQQQERW